MDKEQGEDVTTGERECIKDIETEASNNKQKPDDESFNVNMTDGIQGEGPRAKGARTT